jgi:hypothetical protein
MKPRENASIIVDIIVTNNELRALRPVYDSNNPMPVDEPQKSNWLKTYVNTDRIQKRIVGNLGKRSLNKAQKLVNYYSSSSNNPSKDGEYGSILAFEEDFVRLI